MKPVIELANVDLVFGTKPAMAFQKIDEGMSRANIFQKSSHTVAVRNLSMSVESGETIVIMGLSGSGKSSLLRCVNGMNGRRRGTGTLRGKIAVNAQGLGPIDLVGCSESALRRLRTQGMAMVFQQAGLLPWRTVLENVALPLELQGIASSKRLARAHEKLSLVGLSEWWNHLPRELSGGMQQRVGLARALVTDCPILLMDEPFSALDPLIRQQLQTELLNLQKTIGKSILFVSHDMGEALRLGTRIVIMEDGEILQQGTPAQIMNAPNSPKVLEFLAHANPLSALSGETLMTRFDELRKTDWGFDLDGTHRYFCRISKAGKIEWLGDQQQSKALVRAKSEWDRPGADNFLSALAASSLGELIVIYQSSGRPLILLDNNDQPVGVLGEREIFNGLVAGRTSKDNQLSGEKSWLN